MQTLTTDVLVVGAGPAGLTAAALLARLGVPALTMTKYGGTADSPRAHITNQRTVEVLRDLGIEAPVMERALPHHLMGAQVFATAFAGRELSRMATWGTGDERRAEYQAASPCAMCNAPQHVLEPILLARARQLGADIRFDHEVVDVAQDADGVRARVQPRRGGAPLAIHARYAIGCDGARSLVAEAGGFQLDGQADLASAVTVWIEADLTRYTRHRSGALFFVCPPGSEDVFSIWTCVEPWTEWSTIFAHFGGRAADLREDAILARVRAAIGDPSVAVRIKKISPWQVHHLVATEYRRGRLLLAGDAAHRHPPANGLGSNTSIQDAYNLAWKLALVTTGRAGEALLDSYHAERQPVGRQVVERANRSVAEMGGWLGALGFHPGQTEAEALARVERLFGADGEAERQALLAGLTLMNGQFNAHGVELGQRYTSGAVVDDGTPFPSPARDPELHHQPTTHPGAPLPHVWLERDAAPLSTLDLCGYDRFTLLTGIGGDDWGEAALRVTRATGVPIAPRTVGLGQTTNDVCGDWTRRREVGDRGAILVRPDRIVAWRASTPGDDPTAALAAVMDRILARDATARRDPARR